MTEHDGMSHAPWTEDQRKSLNAFQRCTAYHPFTGARAADGSETVLKATPEGWVEKDDGQVVQTWALSWMANWGWQTSVSNQRHHAKIASFVPEANVPLIRSARTPKLVWKDNSSHPGSSWASTKLGEVVSCFYVFEAQKKWWFSLLIDDTSLDPISDLVEYLTIIEAQIAAEDTFCRILRDALRVFER